jgi:hypothetical protein
MGWQATFGVSKNSVVTTGGGHQLGGFGGLAIQATLVTDTY